MTISSQLQIGLALVSGVVAVTCLMPSRRRQPRVIAALFGLIALILLGAAGSRSGDLERDVMFDCFAAVAIVSAALMITDKNPAYSALWFALVTLSMCGLFFLQSAPFLGAATVIVYAGAIIVTFLFVLMLAQQPGAGGYDQRPQHPMLATVSAFLILGAILLALQQWSLDDHPAPAIASTGNAAALRSGKAKAVPASNPLSRPEAGQKIGTLQSLGRSLFGDYLYAVEMAGTLLLIAAIGAIAIAPRRSQGHL